MTTASVAKARLYDINFLRYASTRDGTAADGVDTCWADEVKLSNILFKYLTANTCAGGNDPNNRGIVNIIYRAPTKDMWVFGDK
jgi:hypothetical protein